MPAQTPADVAAALQRALSRHFGRSGEVVGLQRLTGGATKQTWAFDWQGPDLRRALILQQTADTPREPGGPPKLTAAQDAAVMTVARRGNVPAPAVVLVLDAADELGGAYVTERVDGEALGRKLVSDPAFAAARERLPSQCGAVLAAIHRLPVHDLAFLQTLSPADELRIYGGLLHGLEHQHPMLAYALRWVQDHLPGEWPRALVHADFRTGNLIVGPDGLRCVLDWEIARIGDPMQDLGVLCMRTWRFGGAGEVGGFGSREALYAAYEAASGTRIDPERVRFWEVFSNLKWAISCVRRGSARREDGKLQSLELGAVGRRMAEPLWDLLQLTAA